MNVSKWHKVHTILNLKHIMSHAITTAWANTDYLSNNKANILLILPWLWVSDTAQLERNDTKYSLCTVYCIIDLLMTWLANSHMIYTNQQLSILAHPCYGGTLHRMTPCVRDVQNEWNVILCCNQSCTLQNVLHMCPHTHSHMHARMHAHTHACTHTLTHACMHAH